MKIDTIELCWFRGAATKVTLPTGLNSVVVYGDNACGKSSFVDAVEFLISGGKIEHLRNEFSDTSNCLRNTKTPNNEDCKTKINFENGNYIEAVIQKNGSNIFGASSKKLLRDVKEWHVQRHILRQAEVSNFIHLTKSEKYSVLSPLLGLQKYEEIAQNMEKIKKKVLAVTKYQLLQGIRETIQTDIDEILPNIVAKNRKNSVYLRARVYGATSKKEKIENITKATIEKLENLLQDQEPLVKRYLVIQSLTKIKIKEKFESAIELQEELAKINKKYIDHKIPILENTEKIIESMYDINREIDCPACGRSIRGTEFKAHVNKELEELKDVRESRNQAIAEKQSFIIGLSNFISQYKSEKAFLDWLDLSENKTIKSLFIRLSKISKLEPNKMWSSDLIEELKEIINKLCLIVGKEAKNEAPATKKIVTDLSFFQVCSKIPRLEKLEITLLRIDILLSTLDDSYIRIRKEITDISEQVLAAISQDIVRIWSLLHPRQPIENVRLSPSKKNKAIEVCLKFYGKEQSDPRLTLSEGYRNSLGLSIFLALANQDVVKENPIVLDDIVSSLDREHRGMVTKLLHSELANRQVILFTHDREWFGELRGFLDSRRWKFFTLNKWISPQVGIEVLPTSHTFKDAEALIPTKCSSSGNAVRAIMDTELPKAATRLKLQMPYIQGHHNDFRMAVEFLNYFVVQGERFRIKDVTGWKTHQEAINSWKEAKRLLFAWGNPASHGKKISTSEARTIVDSYKKAVSFFECLQCKR